MICCVPGRAPGDQGNWGAQHNQNGAENYKALTCAPMVGYRTHRRRNYNCRQAVHGLPQPDHRTLTVRTDGFACTENIIGWTTPCNQPRQACVAKSSAKMPPKKGVAQISKIDNAVPLSIVRCGSPHRIARPANSEPRPPVISIAANRMPIDVPVSPTPFK
jgi:hypothetical protein